MGTFVRILISALVILLLGFLGAGVFVMTRGPLHPPIDQELPLGENLQRCHEAADRAVKIRCYDGLMAAYLANREPADALVAFNQAMAEKPVVRRDCHQVAHALGRATMEKLGNPELIFDFDRSLDSCGGGFFHGAIEELFRPNDDIASGAHIDLAEFKEKLPTLCAAAEKTGKRASCVHGAAHGAMHLLRDIPAALDTCNLLAGSEDRFGCHTGVFMEYTLSGQAADDNPTSPQYPCDSLIEPYRNPCYYVHSFRFSELGFDGARIVAECRKASAIAADLCLQGYGIFFLAHEVLAGERDKVIGFCGGLNRAESRTCIRGAAARLAALSETGRDAMPFCAAIQNEALRNTCFSAAVKSLQKEKVPMSVIADECRRHLENAGECLGAMESDETDDDQTGT